MIRGKTPRKQDESHIPEEIFGFNVDETVTKLQELYQTVVSWDCTACREADN